MYNYVDVIDFSPSLALSLSLSLSLSLGFDFQSKIQQAEASGSDIVVPPYTNLSINLWNG